MYQVISGSSKAKETLGGTIAASESIGLLTTQGFSSGFITGIKTVLFLLASVSISLCVANLLPIPALDGGLMVQCIAELITKKTFHPKFYLTLQIIGLTIIFLAIGLLTFAT